MIIILDIEKGCAGKVALIANAKNAVRADDIRVRGRYINSIFGLLDPKRLCGVIRFEPRIAPFRQRLRRIKDATLVYIREMLPFGIGDREGGSRTPSST
jgi:hypothetical protein